MVKYGRDPAIRRSTPSRGCSRTASGREAASLCPLVPPTLEAKAPGAPYFLQIPVTGRLGNHVGAKLTDITASGWRLHQSVPTDR